MGTNKEGSGQAEDEGVPEFLYQGILEKTFKILSFKQMMMMMIIF